MARAKRLLLDITGHKGLYPFRKDAMKASDDQLQHRVLGHSTFGIRMMTPCNRLGAID